MTCYTLLVLCCPSDERSNPYFMFHKFPEGKLTLPTNDMEIFSGTCLEAAGSSLKLAAGIDFYNPKTGCGWVILKQNSVVDTPDLEDSDENRVMYIVFSGLLPEKIDLNSDYEWVPLSSIMTAKNILEFDQNIILQAASKI